MLTTRLIADMPISALCLGTADWTSRPGDDLDRLYATFRHAGGNCLDTAHCYAFWMDAEGAPERKLGELIRRNNDRNNVVICTKGCHISGGPKYPRPDRYMNPQQLASDIRDSLERLQIDTIDLYYLHRDDPRVGVDEILDALDEHRQAGRIRHYAASNWQPGRLEAAQSYCQRKDIEPFIASQVLYNLAHLTKPMPPDICVLDDEQEQWYSRHRLPVFAYTANANGYFTKGSGGNYDNPISAARRQRCAELGRQQNATASQIALAYLVNQPFPVIPITGTLKLNHLQDAINACNIKLTPEELTWLRSGTCANRS